MTRLVTWRFCAGSGAAVLAYRMFYHVQQRVAIWKDPFADYSGSGYQIAQSLFAIAAGGWMGTGLMNGSPASIPIVEKDFMFSAITEESGSIFSICLILICISCHLMFLNIATKLTNRFYCIVAIGLGTMYAMQVFLTVGGAMKFISDGGDSFLKCVEH